MTGTDAKEALLSGEPVELNGIVYERMTQIIYEPYQGGIAASAELLDKNARSTTRAPIRYINRIGQKDKELSSMVADVPVDSIILRSFAGEFRIDFSSGETGYIVTEQGVCALTGEDAPYCIDDAISGSITAAICRLRDVTMAIASEWSSRKVSETKE